MCAQPDWFNDQRAVTLAISRQPGSNTMAVVDNIKAILPHFQAQLPSAIKMQVFYDRSQTIRAAVDDVQMTLIIAGLLVVGVIFLFLRRVQRHHHSSLALAHRGAGHLCRDGNAGFNLDNLSLMALTLSVGFCGR